MKRKIKRKVEKPKQIFVIKDTGKLSPKPYKELCEYFYNKGYVAGLDKAKGLEEIKIDALIAVMESKTKYIDNLIEEEEVEL